MTIPTRDELEALEWCVEACSTESQCLTPYGKELIAHAERALEKLRALIGGEKEGGS